MKRILLSLFLIVPTLGIAQVKNTIKKIIPLIEQRQIFLNSATRLNGKTRVDIKIDLPANTVEWYYTFTTTPSMSTTSLNLFSQLSKIYDITGTSAAVINALSVPDGFAPIDVFLMNRQNQQDFNKKDFFGAFQYSEPGSYFEGTARNTRSGKIMIDDLKQGTFFLGFRNPSLNTGINVLIEVVAIVETEEFDNSKWSKETKNKLFSNLKNVFKQINASFSEEIIEAFSGCLVDQITKFYTPESYDDLADYERKAALKKFAIYCDNNKIFKTD